MAIKLIKLVITITLHTYNALLLGFFLYPIFVFNKLNSFKIFQIHNKIYNIGKNIYCNNNIL